MIQERVEIVKIHYLKQLKADSAFGRKIVFNNEGYFRSSGFVNKQNCRIWIDGNPREIHQVPLHSEEVTVWCLVSY